MKNGLVILGLMAIFWSCGSSEKAATSASGIEDQILENLVTKKSFQIESEMAQPSTNNAMNSVANSRLFLPGNSGSNINLTGNPNYLKVKGDTVSAYLPYFGVQQVTAGYGTGSAIEFNGIPDNWKSRRNAKKNSYEVTFTIRRDTEVFQVSLTMYPNLTSHMHINSAQRNFIKYLGKVSELPEENVNEEGL
ncbi:DUF4251 domain-containing protein [Eudoraea sp.]|uniref:DUF4251 domain-containing protein n=1 Tax=Eudoraea sp. TaxID=1979955 RepID=UPI003C77F87F